MKQAVLKTETLWSERGRFLMVLFRGRHVRRPDPENEK